jgi:predicted secreted protein
MAAGSCLLVGAGCSRQEAPAATQAPAEPIFKPIDPAQVPTSTAPLTLSPAAAPPAVPGGAAQPTAMVTDMASGWPIALAVGQEMTARLTADGTAGVRWSMRAGSDAGIVALQGPPASEAPAGRPAVEVFRFKAMKPGSTTLTFDLTKGAAAAIRTVSYPVTVQ